jgi:hypothetical protein
MLQKGGKVKMGECKCEQPELRPKDGKCGEELIEKCHGKVEKHPCSPEEDKKDKE